VVNAGSCCGIALTLLSPYTRFFPIFLLDGPGTAAPHLKWEVLPGCPSGVLGKNLVCVLEKIKDAFPAMLHLLAALLTVMTAQARQAANMFIGMPSIGA